MSTAALALSLSIAFSLWFIIRDSRRHKDVSIAIWIPTVLIAILGSRPLSLWLQSDVQFVGLRNEAPRSVLDESFFLFVLGSSALIALSRNVKFFQLFKNNSALILMYVFFAVSILWSGDPFGSTKRICKDFGLLMVVSVILSEKDPLQAMQAIYFRCASVLFPLSIVFIRFFPKLGRVYSYSGEPTYTGVTTQKNSLGEIAFVFGLFLVWSCVDPHPDPAKTNGKRILWDQLLLLGMGAYLLNISQSKTSLMCLSIAGALIVVNALTRSKIFTRLMFLVCICAPPLIVSLQQFTSIIRPVVEALGRNMTFTGRTDIWAHITSVTVNPLIGAGYWNFWGGKGGRAIELAMNTPIPNAHSGYLDTYLDGGWIGIALLFFLVLVSGVRIIGRLGPDRFQQVRFAILIATILYNLSESMYFRISPLWITTLLAIVQLPTTESVPEISLSGASREGVRA